jgi:hypothetical protein
VPSDPDFFRFTSPIQEDHVNSSKSILKSLFKCLVVSVTTLSTAYGATFSPYQIYPVPVAPEAWPDVVAVGDFNGDGRKDVVLATSLAPNYQNPDTDFHLFLFMQKADGNLAAPTKIAYSTVGEETYPDQKGTRPRTGIKAVDLNKDGLDDIVVGRRKGLAIFLGVRSGTMVATRIDCTTGAAAGDQIAAMDVDRDGKTDIVIHNETSAESKYGINVYFGDGTGRMPRQRYMPTMSDGGVELKIGDFNNDGLDDLAVSWLQGLANGVEIFLHDGVHWFRPGSYTKRPADMIYTSALAAGDFNGDKLDDYVLGGPGFTFEEKGVYFYAQGFSGAIKAPVMLPTGAVSDDASVPDTALGVDINGDNRDDLLQLRSGGQLGYFEQTLTAGLAREQVFPGPYATWSSNQGLATGDINHDGCSDVVSANYNYGLVVWHGMNCQPPIALPVRSAVISDFNANGKSDVLWRHYGDGSNTLWNSGNASDHRNVTGVLNLAWEAVGVGDFNGDRMADVFWRNKTTGANVIWRSGYPTSTPVTRVTDQAWKVAGVGDFDGDHKSDILWRNSVTGVNSIWRAANSQLQITPGNVSDIHWMIVGIGDFDGDSRSDIFWRHRSTGQNVIWRSGSRSLQIPVTLISPSWSVGGVGDFDGDGKSDLLWRNSVSGANTIWKSANSATPQSVSSVTSPGWKIAAVGDYVGDEKSDVFWRNSLTGANAIWKSAISASPVATAPLADLNWSVVPTTEN